MFVSRLNKLVDNIIDRKLQVDPKAKPYEFIAKNPITDPTDMDDQDDQIRSPLTTNYTDSSHENENGLSAVNNFFRTSKLTTH